MGSQKTFRTMYTVAVLALAAVAPLNSDRYFGGVTTSPWFWRRGAGSGHDYEKTALMRE